jgi:predicted amidohydrolase
MDFTVALAQVKPKLGCLADNLVMIEAAVDRALTAGAGMVLFPELALTGYFLRDLVPEVALSLDSPAVTRLADLSRHITIVIGLVEETADHRFCNTALFLEGGAIRHCHRKVYLPTYGLFDEQRYLAAGDRFRAFDSRFGRFGILVCEDMWHLSAGYILAMDGATTLLCPSSSPARGVGSEDGLGSAMAWQRLTVTTSMFLSCGVLFCNRVGYEDGVNFWGGSEVVAPGGTVVARGKLLEEDMVVARVARGALRRERIAAPLLRDENLLRTLGELERVRREREARHGC